MTDEEIKAYVERIEKTSLDNIDEFINILPNPNIYNLDIAIGKICEILVENINILRDLNNDSGTSELDDEIKDLLRKWYICTNYLDVQKSRDLDVGGHKVIFAKTPAGKPYFNIDLSKVPREVYYEVKKTLDGILNGVNMRDITQVRYYTNTDLPQKVLEFKGFQVRIYTTRLKGNILCVFGLTIKKDNNPKKVKEFLSKRLTATTKQIDEIRSMMSDSLRKQELLENSSKILDDVMQILDGGLSDDTFLLPSDEELAKMVPYDKTVVDVALVERLPYVRIYDKTSSDVMSEVSVEKSSEIPSDAKRVKKRTRGLGKKTIARNEITDSLRDFSLEDLIKIQNFIAKLKADNELNEKLSNIIGNIYEGFLNMSDEQIQEFESSIKNSDNGKTR